MTTPTIPNWLRALKAGEFKIETLEIELPPLEPGGEIVTITATTKPDAAGVQAAPAGPAGPARVSITRRPAKQTDPRPGGQPA